MLKHLYFLLLLLPAFAHAQLADNFSDGNFTANPTWTGDAASFQVNAQVLQSNGPAVTTTQIALSTPCQATIGTVWEFWANLRVVTTSGNYADVWLIASQADLRATSNSGYFVRLGGTGGKVSLFRKDSTRTAVPVIDGALNSLSTTNNLVRVRVTRTTANQWTLERDLIGGRTFVAEAAQPFDATYQRSVAVGVFLNYSSTNNRNFYFDDFVVTDATPPLLTRAVPADARQVDVVFNEAVAAASAGLPANYRLQSGAVPVSAQLSATNPAVVRLAFAADFAAQDVLEARNVADLYGNVAGGPLTAAFTSLPAAPAFGDLIISEIFADETPQIGLPLSEYLEIHNRSTTKTLSLRGVRLGKTSSTTFAAFADTAKLLPGQYAIVCGSTRISQFTQYGKVYGPTNFPSLNNGGDQLILRGRDGRTLFEVAYSDTWYRDAVKKDGGWSLEMIDTNNFCAGASNWTASTNASGGTPGRANSVRAANADALAPTLLRAIALNANTVRAYFSEKLDSATAATVGRYALATPGPAITRAAPVGPDFRQVDLTLATALLPSRPSVLTVQTATDCVGNASGVLQPATFALPETAVSGEVVINELLFNPRVSAVRFVEIINRSNKFIDLQGWQIGSVKPDGTASTTVLSTGPLVLAPGQLLAFSSSLAIIITQYPTSSDAANLVQTASLPTFADVGTAFLADGKGFEIDRFVYSKALHLSLLATQDGVSLERIRTNGPTLGSNFHSAASAAGYATPGRPNSQAQDEAGGDQELTITPEVFTPDDDGQQDFATLNYHLDAPGYAASVTVYDALGRLTRHLTRNETLPTNGFIQWDGTDEKGHKAAVGYYILLVELFRPTSGEKREYKKTVVLGARF
ncbi:lamin tail domain-containing protein [Hymenobacter siberiensis]|uniref:lamin tail domain-containing protein n=1 Tax=Hymenobacter siberiensis TaxID=2848396 RepID=UPI001C1E8D5C|nr:lamin tail domain-containing protein [Hymenobacter siberiensis]